MPGSLSNGELSAYSRSHRITSRISRLRSFTAIQSLKGSTSLRIRGLEDSSSSAPAMVGGTGSLDPLHRSMIARAFTCRSRSYPTWIRRDCESRGRSFWYAVEDPERPHETVAVGAQVVGRADAQISLLGHGRYEAAHPQVLFLEPAARSGCTQVEQRTVGARFISGLLAACHDLDLLVVAPQGWIRRRLRRSAADYLIRTAPCPVLVATNHVAASATVSPPGRR